MVTVLKNRAGSRYSVVETVALTEMAEGWFLSAIRMYLKQGKRSLVKYFDEVVAACAQSVADDLATVPDLESSPANSPRRD
jgi:hypothetical protein